MKVLYFAWLRTRTGTAEEQIELPAGVTTVEGLIGALRQRSPGHASALADIDAIRVAVNQEFAELGHPVKAGDEVALFPPVTGG